MLTEAPPCASELPGSMHFRSRMANCTPREMWKGLRTIHDLQLLRQYRAAISPGLIRPGNWL